MGTYDSQSAAARKLCSNLSDWIGFILQRLGTYIS